MIPLRVSDKRARYNLGELSRRKLLRTATIAAGAMAAGGFGAVTHLFAEQSEVPDIGRLVPSFTGPSQNPYWNSVGPVVQYPQKAPLVLLTDRPVQLETPRHYFETDFTPNEAFYVRWHLDEIPNSVDLATWRLSIEGSVERPLKFSMSDLASKFKPVSVAAVNQCSGNSRSKFQPRVPGGQWGHGAMGNAKWTGVPLRELLDATKIRQNALFVQFQGLEKGKGPEGHGSYEFLKSLDLKNPILDECIVAYAMNDQPLPMLNGFPVRLVVPGYFATYWMKGLTWIRVLDKPDENFWMKTGYRVPDTPRGSTTPEDVKAGNVKTVPISRMPVRSFIVTPDGASKLVAQLPLTIRGIAFSGYGSVNKMEISLDGGKSWTAAELGEDHGLYSFRTWTHRWTPMKPGRYVLAARATDSKGNVQPDDGVWNPGGYLWNRIERQEVVVGRSS
ncbi:MAG: molybdopterin-dependent oxidoreductase [Candidatus Acidiferrales bacterium]